MMRIPTLFLALLLQAPAPAAKVIVGLVDGQQVVVENPEFFGFIQGRNSDAVLVYRQDQVHGQMPTNIISKIEFGEYKKGRPAALTLTLRNGQKLDVESERRDFVTLRGKTDLGIVTIKHPDPVSSPLKLTTKKPNRRKDVTIRYLEFPGS